jgi:hypothetical protein
MAVYPGHAPVNARPRLLRAPRRRHHLHLKRRVSTNYDGEAAKGNLAPTEYGYVIIEVSHVISTFFQSSPACSI